MPSATPSSSIPVLPLSEVDGYTFKFIGEGAANVVFEVLGQPGDDTSGTILQDRLLRVPKAGTTAYNYVELQEHWETAVRPLFAPGNVVQQQLVHLGGEAVVARLNAVLEQVEGTRRAEFRGHRVAVTEYGMLVEDMRQRHPDDLTIEVKPKWLSQSLNAPAGATRCRNCAREALKMSKSHKVKPFLCPFSFIFCSTSAETLDNVVTRLSKKPVDATRTVQQDRLADWLQTNTLIPQLRNAQVSNDSSGPLEASASDPKFALAMTLRDCTCFVRIPADPSLPVEAKLADLDKKNATAKMESWQEMERILIEGGFYEGKEGLPVQLDCQLWNEEGWRGGGSAQA